MAFSYRQAKMLPSDDLTTFYKAFLYRPAVSIFKTYKTAKLINPVAPEQKNAPQYYYYGYVTENNDPISRKVNLYNRSTGELVSATTSNIDTGYYYLTTTISGEHYIVTLDDEAGEDYNALVLDKLLPKDIE